MTRPIRVLIAKVGLDGHDVGAKVMCRALRDAGMQVVYTGLRRSPEQVASAAVTADVDVVGLSILSGAHVSLCRRVIDCLKTSGAGGISVILGGCIPDSDRPTLKHLGVVEVFPTGTPFPRCVAFLNEEFRHAQT